MASIETKQSSLRYYVSHDGQVRGPFNLQMIEVMVLAGHFPADLFVCREGTEEWIPLNSLNQPPRLKNEEISSPEKNYGADSSANTSLKIVASVVALIIVGTAISILSKPSKPNSYSSAKTSYKPPASSYAPPKVTDASPSYTSKTEYRSPNAISDTTQFRNAQGQTFRVPKSSYERLIAKKALLDDKERSIKLAQAELPSLRTELNRLEDSIDRTSQAQIDLYNAKASAYNSKNNQIQIQIDYLRIAIKDFNAELERVGTPVR